MLVMKFSFFHILSTPGFGRSGKPNARNHPPNQNQVYKASPNGRFIIEFARNVIGSSY